MNTQTPHGWLESLDIGHQFAIVISPWIGPEIHTIIRVTPKQLVFKLGALEKRIDRQTGRLIGRGMYGFIGPVTDELQERIEVRALAAALYRLKEKELRALPLATLRQAHALLTTPEVKNDQAA